MPPPPALHELESLAEVEIDALLDAYGDLALTQFARRFAKLDPARRRALRRRAESD